MAAPTNHWKLGLFVVLGMVVALATLVVLGARSLNSKKTIEYKSFFDESVQGLDVGSPVKFRGVTVGNVSNIDIAPDHREVAVTSELGVNQLDELGLNGAGGHMRIPPDLRVQLGSQGITGVKYILIDFFPVADYPPPALPFPVPENYIPSARSVMKNLEEAVLHAVDRFPELADRIVLLLTSANHILEEIDARHLPDEASATLRKINGVVGDIRVALAQVDAGKVSRDAQQVLARVDATMTQMSALLERVQGEKGVLRSAERASNAVGDMARNAGTLGPELEETLRDVQSAAAAIQRFGDALDRDGDMLLKGTKQRGPMMLTRAFAILLSTAVTGCALFSKSDAVVPRYFSPELSPTTETSTPKPAVPPLELRLGRVNAGSYIRDKIVFRDSAYEVGYYEERRWTEKPEVYVRRALARALFDRRAVRQVVSGVAPTLEVEMIAFEEVVGPPHVSRIQLDFTLEDDRIVRTSRTIVISRPIKEATGNAREDAVVEALASALDAAVQLVADAVCAELTSESAALGHASAAALP